MQAEHNPEQARKTESHRREQSMNGQQSSTPISVAPLYASPWLAFFYLIVQSWSSSSPEPESEG
jgi:hypothetical protein